MHWIHFGENRRSNQEWTRHRTKTNAAIVIEDLPRMLPTTNPTTKKQRMTPYTCKRTSSPCLPQDTHHVTHRELHISFFLFLQYYCLFLRHTQTGNLIDNWEYYLGGGWYVNYIFPILAHWHVLWVIIRSVFSRYNKLVNKKKGETHCPALLMIRDEEFSCTKVHHTGHII